MPHGEDDRRAGSKTHCHYCTESVRRDTVSRMYLRLKTRPTRTYAHLPVLGGLFRSVMRDVLDLPVRQDRASTEL